MDFFKKHEVLFGILLFTLIVPPLLQFFGFIHFIDVPKDYLALPLMAILAVIPAYIWIRIFNKENPEDKSMIFFAFLAGGISTIPIFFYQKLFQSQESWNLIFFKAEAVNFQNNIPDLLGFHSLAELSGAASNGVLLAAFGIFLVYMGVGALEEVMKQISVNPSASKYLAAITLFIGVVSIFYDASLKNILFVLGLLLFYFIFLRFLIKNIRFQSIDDVIEVAIISALGFAFVENTHYFLGKMGEISAGGFVFFILVRVTVVTVVHVLCSGIMGYHIGLAHFAAPVLQDEIQEGRKLPILRWIHKLFDFPADTIFRFEQIGMAVFFAVMVHAGYDFFMQLQYKVFGFIPLFALIMPLYFIGGLWYLFSLLEDKEDHKRFGKLVEKKEYIAE